MQKSYNLLSYINISDKEAFQFCKENAYTPFPLLAIQISLYQKLKPIHFLSFYKKKPFLLITLFSKKFNFDNIPYYGYVIHNSIKKWHLNKSTHKQILIDQNIKFILEFAKKNKDFNFSVVTEPGEDDFRGIDWALTYNENLDKRVVKGNLYTGLLNLSPELTLEDWITNNFNKNKKRNYKKSIDMGFEVRNIEYIPKDIKNIYYEMFKSQEIYLDEKKIKRFIFIIETFLKKANLVGDFLFFEKLNQEKKTIGYDFFIFLKDKSYYLFGINNPKYKIGSYPSFFWSKYRQAFLNKGIKIIDFIGVNSPSRGHFKTGFGCKVIPYWYFRTEI